MACDQRAQGIGKDRTDNIGHISPTAVPAGEKAARFELLQRFPQDWPRDIELLRQFTLAGQPVAIPQYAVEDELLET
ncbi:hypothetical protein D3C71_1988230 [compost metagenome]